jgi:hypothetical protein
MEDKQTKEKKEDKELEIELERIKLAKRIGLLRGRSML